MKKGWVIATCALALGVALAYVPERVSTPPMPAAAAPPAVSVSAARAPMATPPTPAAQRRYDEAIRGYRERCAEDLDRQAADRSRRLDELRARILGGDSSSTTIELFNEAEFQEVTTQSIVALCAADQIRTALNHSGEKR